MKNEWPAFEREHNFETTFRDAANVAATRLIAQDPKRVFTGFGADCNAEYGDIFLAALWSEPPDITKLKDDIGWISHWEGAFFSDPVFDASEALRQFKSAVQTHLDTKYEELKDGLYDEKFIEYSDAFCEGFMEVVIRVLFELQKTTPALKSALFLVTDHDELNADTIERLKRITGIDPFA